MAATGPLRAFSATSRAESRARTQRIDQYIGLVGVHLEHQHTRLNNIPSVRLLASMLGDEDANIICPFLGRESLLLAQLTGLAGISSSLAMVARLHF